MTVIQAEMSNGKQMRPSTGSASSVVSKPNMGRRI
jgi:hypothetical protein